ncbi:purine and uridine phosphorylase [Aspergillus eucalypticola CBS 122712]|uniref:Purine and uridine phosphorylase n=1 Tax=Aspergillus eucalypticola (strain CBS 122712 / IBT 29274) TaxID=1448314 RepID=A0A317V771_ASPEC|nr:purine and uridine phosphorylase [Aspergillus eucalypticola CBS 122712]PWY69946.1 purine and uridine phosphorylase [Aspergillus eucalypticola CBS 122712]
MPWSTTNTIRDNYYAYYHEHQPVILLEGRQQPVLNILSNLHRDQNGVVLPESMSAQLMYNCVAPPYRTANVGENTILDVPSPAAGAYGLPTGRQYYTSTAGISYMPNNTATALWHTVQSSPLPPSTQLHRQPIHWHKIGDFDSHRPAIRDRSQAPVRITNEHARRHQQWQENLTDDFIRYRNDAVYHTGLAQAGYLPNRGLENIHFSPGPPRVIPDFDMMSTPGTQLESRMTEARQYPAHGDLDQFELGNEAATLGSLSPPRPTSRSDFEIAIICALTVEQDAVHALFDRDWDDHGPAYGKHPCDPNAYSCGAIGRHNVVLVHMPGMGKASAAAVAAHCRVSFPDLKLALVVGVCGALPFTYTDQETILGDVIIGDGIIQYDFGRQYPDQFVRRNTLLDSLGRPSPEIRAHLAKLKSRRGLASLHHAMGTHLRFLQSHPQFNRYYHYPGAEQDVLYKPESNIVVSRRRLEQPSPKPHVHFGAIASGDTQMRSGMRRDSIATKEGIIAFEMEGVGISDNIPHVIIKGVSDYADSHRTKAWQPYAAGTAAACMKAFLQSWIPTGRLR